MKLLRRENPRLFRCAWLRNPFFINLCNRVRRGFRIPRYISASYFVWNTVSSASPGVSLGSGLREGWVPKESRNRTMYLPGFQRKCTEWVSLLTVCYNNENEKTEKVKMFPWKPRFKWRSIPTRYVQCFFNSLICTPFSLFPIQFIMATPINHCPPIVLQRTKAMEIVYNIWNSFFINSYSIRLESRLERGRSNELLYPTIKPLKCLISSVMMAWER